MLILVTFFRENVRSRKRENTIEFFWYSQLFCFKKKSRSSHNEIERNPFFFVCFTISKAFFVCFEIWFCFCFLFLESNCGNRFSILLFEWDLSFVILLGFFCFLLFPIWMLRKLGKKKENNLILNWVGFFLGCYVQGNKI